MTSRWCKVDTCALPGEHEKTLAGISASCRVIKCSNGAELWQNMARGFELVTGEWCKLCSIIASMLLSAKKQYSARTSLSVQPLRRRESIYKARFRTPLTPCTFNHNALWTPSSCSHFTETTATRQLLPTLSLPSLQLLQCSPLITKMRVIQNQVVT